MEKTMTIREGFTFARDHFAELGDDKMVAFFESRLAQVEKKNSAERKPTAKQVANEGIKSAICDWMTEGVTYTAADVAKECPACEGLTVQRVSSWGLGLNSPHPIPLYSPFFLSLSSVWALPL